MNNQLRRTGSRTSFVGCLIAATFAFAVLLAVRPAASHALLEEDIVVASAQGDARLTQQGRELRMKAGLLVMVPATVRTGRDGAAELTQGQTRLSVGADTLLELPAPEARGAPVERIVQKQGNAFYDVATRKGKKLRVETPYLVAVIKGTQFSVAVQEDATSISLFEGSLEIRMPDGADVVNLVAGEVAMLRRGETDITVVRADAPLAVATPRAGGVAAAAVGAAGDGTGTRLAVATGTNADRGGTAAVVVAGERNGSGMDARVQPNSAGAGVGLDASVSTLIAVQSLSGAAGVSLDVGAPAGVDVGASVEIAPTGIDVGAAVDTGIQAGPVAIDAGISGGIEVGAAGAGAGIDLEVGAEAGPAAIDAGVSATLDAGSSGVGADVALDAGIDAGAVEVDVGAGVQVDTGAGAGEPALELEAGAGVAGSTVEVGAGVELGAGTVEVDLGVVGIDLGIGVDLGLDDDSGTTTEDVAEDPAGEETQPTIVETVEDLLDGLFRRPGRP